MTAINLSQLPKISVIIPTRDRPAILQECLNRLVAQSYCPREFIVVDNSIDQQATRHVVTQFPEVYYLQGQRSSANPSATRNLGIMHSTGSVLAFIDDDSYVQPLWLDAIAEAFSAPNVGGLSGRIIEKNTPAQMTDNICRFERNGSISGTFNSTVDYLLDIQYVHGCNHAIARSVITEIGGYDPWLIAYEDPDIGFRIRQAGFRILYVPQMVVEHQQAGRVNQAIQRDSRNARSQYFSTRSFAYFASTHLGLSRSLMNTLFVALPKASVRTFLERPGASQLMSAVATLWGIACGCAMAVARKLSFHDVPRPLSAYKDLR